MHVHFSVRARPKKGVPNHSLFTFSSLIMSFQYFLTNIEVYHIMQKLDMTSWFPMTLRLSPALLLANALLSGTVASKLAEVLQRAVRLAADEAGTTSGDSVGGFLQCFPSCHPNCWDFPS